MLVDLTTEIAKSCAATAWVCGLLAAHQWLLASFGVEAQHDVWDAESRGAAVRFLCAGGQGHRRRGGYRLTGRWGFASGCDNATWAFCAALLPPAAESGPLTPAFLLVPATDYAIEDTWQVIGLAGTGSKTLVLNDVFVPAHRILTFQQTTSGKTPGAEVYARNPTFGVPMLCNIPSCLASVAVGAAFGALDDYLAATSRRVTRGAIAGASNRMAEFATIQLRVADAAASADAAREILLRDVRGCAQAMREGRDGNSRGPHHLPSRSGIRGLARHPGDGSAERVDGRPRARPFKPGAARLARCQCRRTPYQHELGCGGDNVWAARARASARGSVLRRRICDEQRPIQINRTTLSFLEFGMFRPLPHGTGRKGRDMGKQIYRSLQVRSADARISRHQSGWRGSDLGS